MLSNKSWGIAGVVMLGTAALLGTNAAYAVIDLTDEKIDRTEAAVTYAAETLTLHKNGYYVLFGNNSNLNVEGKLDLAGGASTSVTIRFDFDGMVLSDPVENGDLKIDTYTAVGVRTGGAAGDSHVAFSATRPVGGGKRDHVAKLTIDQIGLMPDSSGSVKMTVTDLLGPEAPSSEWLFAVQTARALEEKSTPATLTPSASIGTKFASFNDPENGKSTKTDNPERVQPVGSFSIAPKKDHLDAKSGKDVDLKDFLDENDPMAVVISGDFSFAARVTLVKSKCMVGAGTNLLKRTDDKVTDTGELEPQKPSTFAPEKTQILCIEVPDPGTDPATITNATYMVKTTYKEGLTKDPAFLPPGGEYVLGSIERDSADVRLPYLTTNPRYNQRIRIVNTSAVAAKYEISFFGADDVAGDDASGTVESKSTKVLSLRNDDVVTIGSGTATSGEISVEASSGDVSVATIQTNIGDGSTDTVVLQLQK